MNTAPTTSRVAVCGASGIYRAGLVSVLNATTGIEVIGEFDDVDENLQQIGLANPNIVLVDLDTAGAHSRAIRAISRNDVTSTINVVALSSSIDSALAIDLLRGGMSGYLRKGASVPSLIEAIRVVEGGGIVLSAPVADALMGELEDATLRPFPISEASDLGLTRRQIQILGLVGLGMTNAEIAEELQVGRTTVKSHISALLRVLGLRDRTQLAVLAWQKDIVPTGRSHAAANQDQGTAS